MSHTRSSQSHLETQTSRLNWSEHCVGESVDVQYPDGQVEKAKIDVKPPNSRIAWILSYAGQGLRMHGDGECMCLNSTPREHGGE
jgi:hypothetical protein